MPIDPARVMLPSPDRLMPKHADDEIGDSRRRSTGVANVIIVMIAVLAVVAFPVPAAAVVPGINGPLLFSSHVDFSLQNDIFRSNVDGTSAINLTNSPGYDGDGVYSPDGARIAFATSRVDPHNIEIYIMNSDGGSQTRLTNQTGNDFEPAFSPDGARIVFTSDRDTAEVGDPFAYELYAMDSDGSNITRLTSNTARDSGAVFSPDGTRIAFNRESGIWIMNSDGTEPRLVRGGSSPSFSPDGTRIAFHAHDVAANSSEIYTSNLDGSNPIRLTQNDSISDLHPVYSPDGQQIVFVRLPNLGTSHIYVMNVDGTAPTRVTNNPRSEDSPDWGLSGSLPPPGVGLALTANPDTQIVGGGNTVTLRASGAGPQGTPVSFRVTSGPSSGFTGSSSVDAAGSAIVFLEGVRSGIDLAEAWLDRNANGLIDPGEPSATTSVFWISPLPPINFACGDARFIALGGSGEKFRAVDDLTISPTVNSSFLAFKTSLGRGKSISLRVVDYPAESVLVIPNYPRYIGGKNQGVDKLLAELRSAKEQNCPKIVLSGYSQGAIAIHQAISRPEIVNDSYYQKAIRGIILIADGSRVSRSAMPLFGTARSNSSGLCLGVPLVCQGTEPITDIAPAFRRVAVNVCNVNDVVCDYSTLTKTYRRVPFVGLIVGKTIHTTYAFSGPVTQAGQFAARNVNS